MEPCLCECAPGRDRAGDPLPQRARRPQRDECFAGIVAIPLFQRLLQSPQLLTIRQSVTTVSPSVGYAASGASDGRSSMKSSRKVRAPLR